MKRSASAAIAAAIVMSAATAAHAVTQIQFNPLEARFLDGVGTTVTYTPPAPGFATTAMARWGGDTGSGQSGYDFATATPPLVEPVDFLFSLGTFTHINQPIDAGTSISEIKLEVRGDISFKRDSDPAFSTPETKSFTFDIDHWETPNGADPCADGGAQGVGVNANGCADRVIIANNPSLVVFDIDGVEYTLQVLGFFEDLVAAGSNVGGGTFWSAEEGSNERILAARFTEKVNVIPLPAGALLLLSGFAVVAATRRFTAA